MAGAPTGPTLRGSRHRRRSGAGHLSGHLAQARFLSSTGRGGGLDLGGGHPPVDRPAQAPVRPGTGPARVSVPEPSAGPRDAWLSSSPSAEDQVLLGVEHGHLAGALNRLSPELRAVVQATVLDGLTTRDAGRLLGIPAGTVKTRMMRARIQLREALT